MIKNYFKQAWASTCHNKVSTVLYLSGVALAVTTVMIISIVFHTQLSPIYPEYNRNRMAYVHAYGWITEDGYKGSSGFPWQLMEPLFMNLKNAEALSIFDDSSISRIRIQKKGSERELAVDVKWVNDGFFRVYTYEFLAGSPLSAADVTSAAKVAVIDRPTAETMFGSVEGAIGKTFIYEEAPFTVKGVVREASQLTSGSYANAFMPLSLLDRYGKEAEWGAYRPAMLLKKGSTIDNLRDELTLRYKSLTQAHAKVNGITYDLMDQPKSHYTQTFNSWSYPGYEKKGIEKYLITGLVLLLVPALNLSGLISGNVRGRANEIGIRKSFGASRFRLLGEVVTENFILTLAGSIIGLFVAWCVIIFSRDWIFTISDTRVAFYKDPGLHSDMLFSPVVFLIAFGAALLLNTVSSLVPAWHSLSRPIVESLNQKL